MKNVILFILTSLLLTFCTPVLAELYPTHIFPITLKRVVDGDTIDVKIDLSLGIKTDQRVRVYDFDAPETWRPKTQAEREHGQQATLRTIELLKPPLRVKVIGWGVYNRVEGIIILNDDRIFSDVMKEEGYSKLPEYKD